jgi:LysR family transcriptional regulator, transcription activator of glutamate synthase operon
MGGALMEIHQLQYIVEVAKHRHFTHAAEEICVAQSSLSQQITKLEEELGIKLFERTTRFVNPTPAGLEFISYAKKILAEIELSKQCMQAHVGLTKGTLHIGAITTLENIGFVSLITSFHNLFPGLYLDIALNGSYHLAEMLRTSEIDTALLTPPELDDDADIVYYPLGDDEFVLATASSSPLATKKVVDLSELSKENFIFPSPDQSIHKIYLKACRDAGFTPTIVCQSSHSETSLALVSDGMGIGFFPLGMLLANTSTKVSIIRLAKPIKKHVAMALLKRSHYTPAVAAFRDYVLKRCQNAQQNK